MRFALGQMLGSDTPRPKGGASSGRWASQTTICAPLRVKEYPAEWDRYGRAAGPIRNKQMIDYIYPGGVLVVFPGGSGTRNVTKLAEKDAIRVIRASLLR